MEIQIIKEPIRKEELRRIAREVFCDAVYGGKLYQSSFEDMERYLDRFAFSARKNI